MRINEDNYEVFKKLEDKGFKVNINWSDAENIEGFIFDDSMFELIEDLAVEIGNLEEEMEDREEYYKNELKEQEQYYLENYRPIPRSEQECWEPRG